MRPQQLGKLSVPTTKGYELLNIQSIEFLESDDQLTKIYDDEKQVVTGNKNIGYFEEQLKELHFERVHNRVLVNLTKIKEYNRQEGMLIMISGKKISISREKGKNVLRFLRQTGQDEKDNLQETKVIASIIIHDKDTPQQKFELTEGKFLVGRKSKSKPCDIMIDTADKSISRNHFFLEIKNDENGNPDCSIFIDGPLNKTSVNRIVMEPGVQYPLKTNSIIRAGETDILFTYSFRDGEDPENTLSIAGL